MGDAIGVGGLAIHDGETQARSGLPQAVFDHLKKAAPPFAQEGRFGAAEEQDGVDPSQELAAAADALFALRGLLN